MVLKEKLSASATRLKAKTGLAAEALYIIKITIMDQLSCLPERQLFIKHMVCPRCIFVVKNELEKLEISVLDVRLGEVDLAETLDEAVLQTVKNRLENFGFELIRDQRTRLVEQIKNLILDMVRYKKEPVLLKYSEYLARETGKDYSLLSNQFSASENLTIEKYIILQKIEYVKELLTYNELSLSQIASQVGYRDVGYLSRQFKIITGTTPTAYKKLTDNGRKPLNEIISPVILQN